MTVNNASNPLTTTQLDYVRYRAAHLHVYRTVDAGVVVGELFSFQSLADCLQMEMPQANALYQRRRLNRLMVPIRGLGTRPLRGFHLSALEEIVEVMETPGARPREDAAPEPIMVKPAFTADNFGGHYFYTIESIALQLGKSNTSIRNRLKAANMLHLQRRVYEAGDATGGRPRLGFPVEYAAQLGGAILGTYVHRDAGLNPQVGQPVSTVNRITPPDHDIPPAPAPRVMDPCPPPVAVSSPAAYAPDGETVEPWRAHMKQTCAEINAMMAAMPKPVPAEGDASDWKKQGRAHRWMTGFLPVERIYAHNPALQPADPTVAEIVERWRKAAAPIPPTIGSVDPALNPNREDFAEVFAEYVVWRQLTGHPTVAARKHQEKKAAAVKARDAAFKARDLAGVQAREAEIAAMGDGPAVPDGAYLMEALPRAMGTLRAIWKDYLDPESKEGIYTMQIDRWAAMPLATDAVSVSTEPLDHATIAREGFAQLPGDASDEDIADRVQALRDVGVPDDVIASARRARGL